MKKLLCMMLALAMALALIGCGGNTASNGEVNVYNWSEYMDEDLLKDFQRETGIKVNYSTYTDNETMYSSLKNGTSDYDVVFPSDYMISRLISEDMLQKLNFDNIPNYSNIDQPYLNLEYDPTNEYSVPYMWGVVGVIYNTTMVDRVHTSWDILWDESLSGQILMFDNSRDALAIALERLGYSVNTTDENELNQALELLKEQKPLVQAYVMDQIFDKMESGEAAVAPYYAGDAITMMEENPDLAFFFPKEGSNRYVDAMCVLKDCPNKENAEAFINYMCTPEAMAANEEIVRYALPSEAGRQLSSEELRNSEICYPSDDVLANTEVFINLPQKILDLYDQMWIALKAF